MNKIIIFTIGILLGIYLGSFSIRPDNCITVRIIK